MDPTVEEYEAWVARGWSRRPGHVNSQYDDLKDLFVMCVGSAGELGEVLEPIKKSVRDGRPVDRHELCLELGDVLHYITRIALQYGLTLGEVMAENRRKLETRRRQGKTRNTKEEVQHLLGLIAARWGDEVSFVVADGDDDGAVKASLRRLRELTE